METVNEAWLDNTWWARREGNRIWIGRSYEGRAQLTEAVLVLALTEEGGITLDPRWEKLRLSEIAHEQMWAAMLRSLILPVVLESKLSEPPPLCFFSEKTGMQEYLRKVAQGELHHPSLDKEERELLTQALDANYPEGQS